ncbi:uncharacterized protein CMU_021670 [Cryptosporidium muris RN66]|uniref:Transmembrane protein n=1 Tax=Cryptosporidium muris (strain RN66) TaxID=441375 RepID=B6AJL2_CRYMR|nr:uncharacterized protein CMU_021670 [Cryptosporidium muris RN66]EEA08403.1 hypothetical protein, conserved [Cryptosporidium muris RN66]|eukprot:XP_002142752.1 hypothetical protein [Cryptosporidium muris RN66]
MEKRTHKENDEQKEASTEILDSVSSSFSTRSVTSTRYFDAQSWEERRDIVALRIPSPASELYIDGEFSPSTQISSPVSYVDIRTPQKVDSTACCSKSIDGIYQKEIAETSEDNNTHSVFSTRLVYLLISVAAAFILVMGILGTLFFFATLPYINGNFLENLDIQLEGMIIKVVPEEGFQKAETSEIVSITMPPLKENTFENTDVRLLLEGANIEWNSLVAAVITKPQSLEISQASQIKAIIETKSNDTHIAGLSGIIHDILSQGYAKLTLNAFVHRSSYFLYSNSIDPVSKELFLSMSLRQLITNIQLTDLILEKDVNNDDTTLTFMSNASYDYKGIVIINTLGKIFCGIFHDGNYLGVVRIEDSSLVPGEKTNLKIFGTLNTQNFINDAILVSSMKPSLDFGINKTPSRSVKLLNLHVEGVGSSSIIMDSPIRLTRSNVNLAILPPQPLRQVPNPIVVIESIAITENNTVTIKGVLRTTFYGYLSSSNQTPNIEHALIQGLLHNNNKVFGQFTIVTANSDDNDIQYIKLQMTDFATVSSSIPTTSSENINSDSNRQEEIANDGVPYHAITISPYIDYIDINVVVKFSGLKQLDITDIFSDKQNNNLDVTDINIYTSWNFLSQKQKDQYFMDKASISFEIFNFVPILMEYQIVGSSIQAVISLHLEYTDGFQNSSNMSYSGPLTIYWICNSIHVTDFVLDNVDVTGEATKYLLASNKLIPDICTMENSKLIAKITKKE